MTDFSKSYILGLGPCTPWCSGVIQAYPDEEANGSEIKAYVEQHSANLDPIVWMMGRKQDLATEFVDVVGINVDLQDSNGKTALHYAVQYRQSGVITYLLGKGANKYLQDNEGITPEQAAILSENISVQAAMGV